jgi:hypothetical protein
LANLGLPYSFCYETCAGAFIKYQRDEQQLQLLPFEFEIRVQLKRATGLRKGFTRNSLFRASLLAARTAAPYFFSQGKHQAIKRRAAATGRTVHASGTAGLGRWSTRDVRFGLKYYTTPLFFTLSRCHKCLLVPELRRLTRLNTILSRVSIGYIFVLEICHIYKVVL